MITQKFIFGGGIVADIEHPSAHNIYAMEKVSPNQTQAVSPKKHVPGRPYTQV